MYCHLSLLTAKLLPKMTYTIIQVPTFTELLLSMYMVLLVPMYTILQVPTYTTGIIEKTQILVLHFAASFLHHLYIICILLSFATVQF